MEKTFKLVPVQSLKKLATIDRIKKYIRTFEVDISVLNKYRFIMMIGEKNYFYGPQFQHIEKSPLVLEFRSVSICFSKDTIIDAIYLIDDGSHIITRNIFPFEYTIKKEVPMAIKAFMSLEDL